MAGVFYLRLTHVLCVAPWETHYFPQRTRRIQRTLVAIRKGFVIFFVAFVENICFTTKQMKK